MASDIKISREELYKLIRIAVRDEINEIKDISDEEQLELEKLHGKMPSNAPINFDESIEL
jgi:hypothetical protein